MESSNRKMKICHVTSAHKDGDVRIFHKEAVSLAEAGFDVIHLVPNSKSRVEKGVNVVSFDFPVSSRFKRMFFLVKEVYKRALEINADVYHLHDPELLRIALKLKARGKKVIYDAHEDVPRDIMTKEYIPKFLRGIISRRFERFENKVVSKIDGVITATPFIRDRFLKINTNTIDVNNYPLKAEFDFDVVDWSLRKKQVCYIGIITKIRGIKEIVDATAISKIPLMLAGEFKDGTGEAVRNSAGWQFVSELGMISRTQAVDLKNSSLAGLVIFHPVANHIDAQPNKIFEYMASGLPIIGSDFPLWKTIIQDGNCGICVNPMNPQAIAEAIVYISENPELAKRMGENGQRLVREIYNWEIEKKKLVDFYLSL